jgi:hypothetical protein
MRAADITMTGELWEYRPAQHKTAWRGRGRVVVLGPKAQAVVKPLLTVDVQAYLFSRAAWAAGARSRRRTK